jgi:lipoate-protein ligase B
VPDKVWVAHLGCMAYEEAFALQRRVAEDRDAGRVPDLLLFVEHPPVITLGRRGSRDDIYAASDQLAALGISVHETNRGGLVTYHGPGQVVGYPIARLRTLAGDAPTYVRGLETTIIRTLAGLGVAARRDACHRGVFADGGKLAAIGVAVSRGVTMHGFALNLQPDLDHFALINPCGIGGLGVTSVERVIGRAVDPGDVRSALAFHFGEVFDRTMAAVPSSILNGLCPADPSGSIGVLATATVGA